MRTLETLTWLGVVAATLAYISRLKAKEMATVLPPPPSSQREIDPTRWRHAGDQPANYGSYRGNAQRVDDVEVVALTKALAF